MARALYQFIVWTLAALCALMIYGFSAQDAEQSGTLSEEATDVVALIVRPELAGQRDDADFISLHNAVRKAAHMAEYALLALLVLAAMAPLKMKPLAKLLLALLISAALASLDEWHQSFVEGRGPQVLDVLIDTLGAGIGAALAFAGRWFMLWFGRVCARVPEK